VPAAKKVAVSAPPKPVAVSASDDLDSLLSDLGSGIGTGGGGAARNVGKGAPAPAKVVAAAPKKVAAPAADDLDALMADLGAPAAAPKKVASPAPGPKKVAAAPAAAAKVDDLDALMADLGGAPAKAPVAAKKVAPVATANKVDDLDALMADLGGAPAKVPAAAKKVAVQAKATASSDELDSLMADLGGSSKATTSFKVAPSAPVSATAKARADELDSLMDSLGGSGSSGNLHAAGGVKKSAANDLDDLMHSLSSSPATSVATPYSGSASAYAGTPSSPSMRPATAVSRPPAGSLSRFEDLMTTVTADMSDLASPNGSRSRGVCYHCRQPIYDECMQALGRTYHPEHFMCGSCNNPLGTGSFFELAGQAHCQRCYQIQFCPKCAHCNQAISDRCVTALDKKWHIHCFVCTQCTSPFQGNFFERDGRPYCDKCFHQVFAPRCRSCNQPVLGDCVNALGAQWHPEHFNCQFCRRAFTGTFFEYEGMPYCEAHYYQKMGSSCAGCQQPISGACVDALSKKWHPEHFVCAFCMNQLEGTSYSEKNAKPYCRPCFGKLFGS
jgi:paxillin